MGEVYTVLTRNCVRSVSFGQVGGVLTLTLPFLGRLPWRFDLWERDRTGSDKR